MVRDGHVLDCDWLKTQNGAGAEQEGGTAADNATAAADEISLHSKCLYVDRLPKDYRDMGEFRRLFSAVVNPPYCQVRRRTELQ